MQLLILEDEPILLDKYTEYLKDSFESIHKTKDLEEAFNCIENHEYDVALIDYNLPDGEGLKLLKEFPKGVDAPLFVLLTAYSKEKVAIESLNLGVFKYLEKPIDKVRLVSIMKDCILEAKNRESIRNLKKKFTISQKTKDKLTNEYFVSKRELEVLEATLIHQKNKIIGEKLFISQGTVRNHLSSIFQKLHINSKEELSNLVETMNS